MSRGAPIFLGLRANTAAGVPLSQKSPLASVSLLTAMPPGWTHAMPIVIDDILAYHDRMIDLGRDVREVVEGQVMRPPYPQTWLEGRALREDETIDPLVGVALLCMEMSRERAEREIAILNRRSGARAQMAGSGGNVVCVEVLLGSSHAAVFAGCGFIPVDDEWRRTREHMVYVLPSEYGMPSPGGGFDAGNTADQAAAWFTIAMHALTLFHVKNATLAGISNRRDRRRDEQAGLPHVVVRELVIAPLRRSLEAIRRAKSESGEIPFHLCRGHFKTFTGTAPLLGRFVGTYWWEPHWRGSEHVGAVLHDRAELRLPGHGEMERST